MDKTEQDFQNIFKIVTGSVDAEYPFHWVKNAFVPGTQFSKAYEEIWNARVNLCQRFDLDVSDDDMETIMNAIMDLEEDLGRRMFLHGIQYANTKIDG